MNIKIDKHFVLILLSALIIYFSGLGNSSIYFLDEAKNSACAMEMMMRNDLITPTFNGQLRTDKPPLHYYFMMLGYKLFGIKPFAARFFSALAGVMLVCVVYFNVKKLINKEVAIFSSIALLSSVQLTIQFHLAVPDPYLILFLTIALFAFFRGFYYDGRHMKFFYLAIALAFLTKGLIAIVLPGMTILTYLALAREFNWNSIRKLKIDKGILLFAVVALPWYAIVGFVTEGEWLKGFFLDHNVRRYTSTMEGHRGFPGAPVLILWVALLPFSVFIIQAVKIALNEWKEKRLLLLSLVICILFTAFFSFSKTLLPSYPAPAIPFLAIVLGNLLAHLAKGLTFSRGGITRGFILNTIVSVAVCVAGYLVLSYDSQLRDTRDTALAFVLLPVAGTGAWFFFAKGKRTVGIYMLSGSWIMFVLVFLLFVSPAIDAKNPTHESIPLTKRKLLTHHLAAYKQFNPAYVFNLQRQIDIVDSPQQFIELASAHKKILLITRAKYLNEIPALSGFQIVYRGKDLFEDSETVLIAN